MIQDLKGKAFQRSWSKTCQAFQTKYLSITSDAASEALTNDNEKVTLQKAQVFDVSSQK